MTASRKRFIRIATVSAVAAVPMGVAMAGHAAADGLDTGSISGLGSALPGVGNLPIVGGSDGITGAVTNLVPLAGVLGATPLGSVAGSSPTAAGSSIAQDPTSVLSQLPVSPSSALDPVSSLPVVGSLAGTATHAAGGHGLPSLSDPVGGLGSVIDGLGLKGVTDTLKPVTGTVDGLLNGVTGNSGLLGGVLGGNNSCANGGGLLGLGSVVGGLLGSGGCAGDHVRDNGGNDHSGDNGDFQNDALPHTGGDSNMTALLLCSGLGLAGAGVTLVARRRGGIGA
jgi:hypothetical protein